MDYTFKMNQNMAKNLAGGTSFKQDKFVSLRKWLLIGSMSNFFYATKEEMTEGNIQVLNECIEENPQKVGEEVFYASKMGVSVHTPILALVPLSMGNETSKKIFKDIFPQVIRTASHLYEFMEYVKKFRGFGNIIQKTVQRWLDHKSYNDLEYQFLKYQNRYNWKHRDVLRKVKPKTYDPDKNSLYAWVVGKSKEISPNLQKISVYENLKKGDLPTEEICSSIITHNLTHEMIPSNIQRDEKVWEALFLTMPMHATIRNIITLNRYRVFDNPKNIEILEERLSSDNLKKSYVHPIELVKAYVVCVDPSRSVSSKSKEQGLGDYKVPEKVISILEKAIYDSFEFIEPVGCSFYHALDVSGSMLSRVNNDMLFLLEIEGIFALSTIKKEKNYFVGGFSDNFIPLSKFTADMNFKEILCNKYRPGSVWPPRMSATDASKAYEYAIKNKIFADVFVFWTDSENWVNDNQPHEWLRKYRHMINPNAKAIYITLAPYHDRTTLSDPSDPLSYDIVGYTSETPKIIQMIAKENF